MEPIKVKNNETPEETRARHRSLPKGVGDKLLRGILLPEIVLGYVFTPTESSQPVSNELRGTCQDTHSAETSVERFFR